MEIGKPQYAFRMDSTISESQMRNKNISLAYGIALALFSPTNTLTDNGYLIHVPSKNRRVIGTKNASLVVCDNLAELINMDLAVNHAENSRLEKTPELTISMDRQIYHVRPDGKYLYIAELREPKKIIINN
jgi:hypothetical protein